jgi:hypothetical protein
LILVDGRSVYSPLFSGVYTDALDVPLEARNVGEAGAADPGGDGPLESSISSELLSVAARVDGDRQRGHAS